MNKKIVIYVKDPINAQYEVDRALNDRLHKLCDELNQLIGKQDIQRITDKYCKEHDLDMVTRGNLTQMEDLLDLFDPTARDRLQEQSRWKGDIYMGTYITKKAQFVLNKLDRESKKPDAIFKKSYICYNGIINRPTRCFEIKEKKDECSYCD